MPIDDEKTIVLERVCFASADETYLQLSLIDEETGLTLDHIRFYKVKVNCPIRIKLNTKTNRFELLSL